MRTVNPRGGEVIYDWLERMLSELRNDTSEEPIIGQFNDNIIIMLKDKSMRISGVSPENKDLERTALDLRFLYSELERENETLKEKLKQLEKVIIQSNIERLKEDGKKD